MHDNACDQAPENCTWLDKLNFDNQLVQLPYCIACVLL